MTPYYVPIITYEQIEGIKDDVSDIRARLEVARELRARGRRRSLMTTIFSSWTDVTREAGAKPAARTRPPGPIQPCPCGSGRKHKKCCGGPAERDRPSR